MNRMRRVRKRQAMTQAEICIRTGLDPATVCRIERGVIKGNQSHRRKIARALGAKVEDVFPEATDGRS